VGLCPADDGALQRLPMPPRTASGLPAFDFSVGRCPTKALCGLPWRGPGAGLWAVPPFRPPARQPLKLPPNCIDRTAERGDRQGIGCGEGQAEMSPGPAAPASPVRFSGEGHPSPTRPRAHQRGRGADAAPRPPPSPERRTSGGRRCRECARHRHFRALGPFRARLLTPKLTLNDLRQRYERSLFLIRIYFIYIFYN
jgi:hypothetical protein